MKGNKCYMGKKGKTLFKTYLIQAHKNPKQLKRLIECLDDSISEFYIHIDLKSNFSSFKEIINKPNVFFIDNRVDCIWGDYSQVQATLNLLQNALSNPQKEGHLIFLSGQDYPIKPLHDFDEFLKIYGDHEFISYSFNPIPLESEIFIERIEKYKINLSSERGDFLLLPPFFKCSFKDKRAYVKHLVKGRIHFNEFISIFINKREALFDFYYKGSQWWCLKSSTALQILNYYLNDKEKIDTYFKYTFCPDELFFHTIIKKIMQNDNSIKIMPNLHFIDWNRSGVTLPVTFQEADFDILFKQPDNKMFARKFDIECCERILDLIDEKKMGPFN